MTTEPTNAELAERLSAIRYHSGMTVGDLEAIKLAATRLRSDPPVDEQGVGASLRDRATHERSPSTGSSPTVSVPCAWQNILSAPKDGSYILAIVAENDSRHMGHMAGRVFAIRHEGRTPSDYDMGWAVYPGFGGAPDSYFTQWMPLPTPPASAIETRQGEDRVDGLSAQHESAVPSGRRPDDTTVRARALEDHPAFKNALWFMRTEGGHSYARELEDAIRALAGKGEG